MNTPRILITTYHQAFLVRGGGEYEMFSVADSLKRKGFIVDIYGPYSRSIDDYDVILHFSVHGGGIELLREIKNCGRPIILWPNLWSEDCGNDLFNLVNAHVEISEAVVFKSETELSQFNKLFYLPKEKAFLTHFSADPSYLRAAPPDLFRSLYSIGKYAIWFGVIEPSKNQLAAIKVLKDKDIPLVLVGRYRDKKYYEECKKIGGDGTIFIEGLPQKSEIVRSALRESLFYIEVSHEPPGLSAIEAGLCGCRLLLSDSDWSREHFADLAVYADPTDNASISNAVDLILDSSFDSMKLIKKLEKHCLPMSIDPLIDIIKRVI